MKKALVNKSICILYLGCMSVVNLGLSLFLSIASTDSETMNAD